METTSFITKEFDGQPVEFMIKGQKVYINATQVMKIAGYTPEDYITEGNNTELIEKFEKAHIKYNLSSTEYFSTDEYGIRTKHIIPAKEDPYEFFFEKKENSKDVYVFNFLAYEMLSWTQNYKLLFWADENIREIRIDLLSK